MRGFFVRRLLLILPTLLIVTIIIFLLIRLIPGSVIDLMAAQSIGDQALNVQLVKENLGLDVPIHIQYGRWISNVLHGDLGKSLHRRYYIAVHHGPICTTGSIENKQS